MYKLRNVLPLVALIVAASLNAQAPPTPAPLPPEAQKALKKGIIAAKEQDYLLAIRFFQDARKIAPNAAEIYYDLGLAESKIPGRELRAIAWLGAYLAANPNASNAATVRDQVDALDVKSQSNISHVLKTLQESERDYDDVAKLWAESGDFVRALNVADLIGDKYLKGMTQEGIARSEGKAGEIAAALKTADLIQDMRCKSGALRDIAMVQRDSGDIIGARGTLSSALLAANQIQNGSGSVKGFERSIEQTHIAAMQVYVGDIAGAHKTLAYALQSVDLIDDAQGKDLVCTQIVPVQVAEGDLAGAQRTVALIQNTVEKVGPEASITYLQLKMGDISGAYSTLALPEIKAFMVSSASYDPIRGYINSDWSNIATAQAKAGDILGAQKTADLIQNEPVNKIWALRAITVAQAKTGDFTGAQKTADLIQSEDHKNWALGAIAEAQIKAGDFTGAQKTANLVQEMYRNGVLQDIVNDQVKAGDFTGAQKTAELFLSSVYTNWALKAIAEAQAKAGSTNRTTTNVSPTTVAHVAIVPVATATNQPAVEVITVFDWLNMLDGVTYSKRLNAGPFLDLASYLKSLPRSDDPEQVFKAQLNTVSTIIEAQNTIEKMLKHQAKK